MNTTLNVILLGISAFALLWVLEISTRHLIPKVRKRYYPSWLRFIGNIIVIIFVYKMSATLGEWAVVLAAVIMFFILDKLLPSKPNGNT